MPRERREDEQYTVKSGYFCSLLSKFGSLTASCGFEGWKKLWGFNLPPKFTVFFFAEGGA